MGELAAEINQTLTRGDLVLTPGDIVEVNFPRFPAWSQQDILIQSDGSASFLSLDSLRVAGMTLAILDAKLTHEYEKILAQPELSVRVTHAVPRTITVLGEVSRAGKYPITDGRLSLIEALGLSEGFVRDTAKLDHTLLVRWIPSENRIRSWKIDAHYDEWHAEESILLQAHDVVFIPAKAVVHVNDWIDRYIRRMIPFPYLTRI